MHFCQRNNEWICHILVSRCPLLKILIIDYLSHNHLLLLVRNNKRIQIFDEFEKIIMLFFQLFSHNVCGENNLLIYKQ